MKLLQIFKSNAGTGTIVIGCEVKYQGLVYSVIIRDSKTADVQSEHTIIKGIPIKSLRKV